MVYVWCAWVNPKINPALLVCSSPLVCSRDIDSALFASCVQADTNM